VFATTDPEMDDCSRQPPIFYIAIVTAVFAFARVGRAAVEFAIAGKNAVMPAIRRLSDRPYRWDIIEAPLSEVAN
jgi:6-phosphofructokinase 1